MVKEGVEQDAGAALCKSTDDLDYFSQMYRNINLPIEERKAMSAEFVKTAINNHDNFCHNFNELAYLIIIITNNNLFSLEQKKQFLVDIINKDVPKNPGFNRTFPCFASLIYKINGLVKKSQIEHTKIYLEHCLEKHFAFCQNLEDFYKIIIGIDYLHLSKEDKVQLLVPFITQGSQLFQLPISHCINWIKQGKIDESLKVTLVSSLESKM